MKKQLTLMFLSCAFLGTSLYAADHRAMEIEDQNNQMPLEGIHAAHNAPVQNIQWGTGQSSHLIASSEEHGHYNEDEASKLKIWDARTGKLAFCLQFDDEDDILSINWSPDGSKLAIHIAEPLDEESSRCDTRLHLFQVVVQEEGVNLIPAHLPEQPPRGEICDCCWSNDGSALARLTWHGEQNGTCIQTLPMTENLGELQWTCFRIMAMKAHGLNVVPVPTDNGAASLFIVSTEVDHRFLALGQNNQFMPVCSFPFDRQNPSPVSCSLHNFFIAFENQFEQGASIEVRNISDGSQVFFHGFLPRLSPQNPHILAYLKDAHTLCVVSITRNNMIPILSVEEISCFDWSPDGSRLVIGTQAGEISIVSLVHAAEAESEELARQFKNMDIV